MQEQISVIITVYNTAPYLEQCLDSVLKQTYQNLEIILVDDGSRDESPQICDAYAKKDSRVLVIHQENKGAPRARKTGYAASHGRYISIIDSDDWLEPVMLETLYNALTTQQTDVAMCGKYEDMDGVSRSIYPEIPAGRYEGKRLATDIYPNLIVNKRFFEWGIFPSFWDKLFKREVLMPYLMEVDDRLPMGNDAAGVYPTILHVKSICVMHECLYHYRQTDHSMVRTFGRTQDKRLGFRLLYQSVLQKLKNADSAYNLPEQWLEYLLFIMIPRADELYEGIERLDYLFPFPKVKRNSRVILYGMGLYGQRLYAYLNETGFCQVVAAADRNYEALQKKGLPVICPDEIRGYDFDAVVVSLSFAGATEAVKAYLLTIIPEEKIHTIDTKIIKEEKALKAFGIL